jgi:hypothetical protein
MPKQYTRVELVLASLNRKTGDIIYTFKQTFPRLILAELNTHTIASKSAASSRAIPTLKQLWNILRDPFLPISIGSYQAGMQAGDEIQGWRRTTCEQLWLLARYPALLAAWLSFKLGAPKQFSNRLVEPWMWVEQLWTSTDVENELLLRNSYMAEPHYELLAQQKQILINRIKAHFAGTIDPPLARKLQVLEHGDWHMPFLNSGDFYLDLETLIRKNIIGFTENGIRVLDRKTAEFTMIPNLHLPLDIAKAVSAARCAWISYYMPGDDSQRMGNTAAALLTYAKLSAGTIRHLSPLQHVATPLPFSVRVGSHVGWMMFRKQIPNEAGGDKVVPSITPQMAFRLLQDVEEGSDSITQLHNLQLGFLDEIKEQQSIFRSQNGAYIA